MFVFIMQSMLPTEITPCLFHGNYFINYQKSRVDMNRFLLC